MDLRDRLTEALKASMRGGDAPRTSTVRMILARLKEADIAARPGGPVGEDAILGLLRGMVKSRRESVELYRRGAREELAAKEEAEIAVIVSFLPATLDDAATEAAVREAVAGTGASTVEEMGRVMAALRARHGAALDLGRAGPMVRAALGG